MMKNAWLWLPLVLLHTSSALQCNPNDKKCACYPSISDFEFQCPVGSSDDNYLIIHIVDGREIQIDCPLKWDSFDIGLLPNVTVSKINRLRMRFCPLPSSFKQVVDHFGVENISGLHYEGFNLSNVVLSKTLFKGLEMLRYVKLARTDLREVEDDVFADFGNLTFLELQGNHLVLKEAFFRNTPFLTSLDLSENQLDIVPDAVFQDLQQLKLLHIWGNSLTTITDATFQGLTSLESLELSSNKLQIVSENAFKHLVALKNLNLSFNRLTTLHPDSLAYNSKLECFVMNNNKNLTLPEKLFAKSVRLKILRLANNQLRELPLNILHGLHNLEEIKLPENFISRIDTVFANLSRLKILDLRANSLVEIGGEAFKDLKNLKELYLQNNEIQNISNRALQNNIELETLDLSYNQYSGDYSDQLILLENVVKLKSVNLSHNSIVQISDVVSVYNKIYLESLDLSYNEITNLSLRDLQPLGKLSVDLQHNNITTVDFNYINIITKDVKDANSITDRQPYVTISISNNPLDCDCHNFYLVRYFQYSLEPQVNVMFNIKSEDVQCASPPELKDLNLKDLPQRSLVCSFEEACPENSSCSWRPFDRSLVLDFSMKGLQQFPQIDTSDVKEVDFEQIELHLEGNALREGLTGNLSGYDMVTRLYLSDNQIEEVEWLPPKLKILHLDNNRIQHLSYEVLKSLNSSSLVNLTLDGNPWRCDCKAANFTTFLREHTKAVDATSILCSNSSSRLLDLNRNDLCKTFGIADAAIGVLMFLLLISVLTIMYFKYKKPLKVWLYSRNLCLWWVTEEELDKDKIYDAFISYSHKDEDFVIQNLIPVLENPSNPYKLCVHFRDWIPGEFILTQVTNSVMESRRTLVVLSPNFLESVWGKTEFRTAHTQAMTEGRARVIIVLLGDVNVDKLDDELKAYMRTNTYVKWGDPYFWNKLKYALPHSKNRGGNNNQKIANVMRCIDEKFNFVTPVTLDPGSTPPVLAVDPQALKKHPLNFVPGSEMVTPPAEAGNLI